MALQDPLQSFHFIVEWGGTRLAFSEVSGLEAETEVIEYRDGSEKNYTVRKLPGLRKFGNVTLKRGIVAGDNEFFEFWQQTYFFTGSNPFRRDIIIKLLDDEHKPVFVWKLRNAWPTKIACSDLKAKANEVAIESLEIAHEGLNIETAS